MYSDDELRTALDAGTLFFEKERVLALEITVKDHELVRVTLATVPTGSWCRRDKLTVRAKTTCPDDLAQVARTVSRMQPRERLVLFTSLQAGYCHQCGDRRSLCLCPASGATRGS